MNKGGDKNRLPVPVVLDTDPGIDDAVALMLALASPGEIDLVGISTTGGNIGRQGVFENAHRLLQLFGRQNDFPVGFGWGEEKDTPAASHIHGADGMGETGLPLAGEPEKIPSVELLAQLVREHSGKLVMVAVGPLTNVAALLREYPDCKKNIARLVIMGGAVKMSGNVTPAAEANIYKDPQAAAEVFSSGLPLQLVPLDATLKALFPPDRLVQFESLRSLQADFFRRLLRFHFRASRLALGVDGSYLHDALAVASLLAPQLLQFEPVHCVVETKGEWTRGMTLCDFRYGSKKRLQPNIEVAVGADGEKFIDLLCQRILIFLEKFEQ